METSSHATLPYFRFLFISSSDRGNDNWLIKYEKPGEGGGEESGQKVRFKQHVIKVCSHSLYNKLSPCFRHWAAVKLVARTHNKAWTNTHTCVLAQDTQGPIHTNNSLDIAGLEQPSAPVTLLVTAARALSDSLSSVIICRVLINEQRLSSLCPIYQAFGQWSITGHWSLIIQSVGGGDVSDPLCLSSL